MCPILLWGNAKVGVLKLKVASPNPQLRHLPLIGRNKDITRIDNRSILEALFVS